MGLSKDLIGRTRAGVTLVITRSRLGLFAMPTGQQDPVFIDVEAAKQAGHRDLPVPRPSCSASTWRGPTPSPTSRSWLWT